jgi:hypothetical protein
MPRLPVLRLNWPTNQRRRVCRSKRTRVAVEGSVLPPDLGLTPGPRRGLSYRLAGLVWLAEFLPLMLTGWVKIEWRRRSWVPVLTMTGPAPKGLRMRMGSG